MCSPCPLMVDVLNSDPPAILCVSLSQQLHFCDLAEHCKAEVPSVIEHKYIDVTS